jgi:putative tricarboxylic transport membrane protein
MIIQAIRNLITLDVLIALTIGIFGGLVVGVLPGLSGAIAISLLIPVTYGMDNIAAIIMLMAIYTTATTGGSFSAILIHTPGTPANVVTAIEGYPLSLQGRGLEAMGTATAASVFGGVFSAVMLLLISPVLARVALLFSDPENFLVAIFGLTIIASLSESNMIKGFLSGTFGLFLGTVGIDAVTGTVRFTFGWPDLISGISLVPMMIGLFCIPQVMAHCENFKDTNRAMVDDIKLSGRFWPRANDFFSFSTVLLRSAVLGLMTGILPGAGANIGSFLSYNEAKRFSKHKEEYGHGSMEGLYASEVANNAVTGGAFIPLLTLGIPGSPVAAIIFGALLIHGFIPGIRLFTTMADKTYAILIGFLIANVAMGLGAWLLAKCFAKVVKVPYSVLGPCIVVLAVLGSFSINQNIFDVYVMLFFTIVGYLMLKVDFPSAPMILGIILGPMAEKGIMNSIVMSKGKGLVSFFLSRNVCLVLLLLISLALIWPLLIIIKSFRKRFFNAKAS